MILAEVWAQLEEDISWRQKELRLLSNALAAMARRSDRDLARRAMLVMLYAHTEGFCKVALSIYVKAINDLKLKSCDVIEGIAAASLGDVFRALERGDRKGRVFKGPLPEDQYLYTFCRRREFVAGLDGLLSRTVLVPADAVDTESNLSSRVLRRNLYKLGLPAEAFEGYEPDLDELVHRRNNIAHGVQVNPVAADLYDRLRRSTFGFMDELALLVVGAIEKGSYLRQPAGTV